MNWIPNRARDKDLTIKFTELATYLYTSELLKLFEANVTTLSQSCERGSIEKVVEWVVKEIKSRAKLEINNPLTYDTRKSQIKILQVALQDLEKIRQRHNVQGGGRDEACENAKIEEDDKKVQRHINRRQPYTHPAIRIYKMGSLAEGPCVIPETILEQPTCRSVIQYLAQTTGRSADVLSLWARYHGRHERTRDRFSWSYIPQGEHVTGMDLEFIDCTALHVNVASHIVALVLQDNRDVPMPVDLPLQGTLCCPIHPPCSGLGEHLVRKLGGTISGAIKIDKGTDVRHSILDVQLFQRQTNNLLVHWQPPGPAPTPFPTTLPFAPPLAPPVTATSINPSSATSASISISPFAPLVSPASSKDAITALLRRMIPFSAFSFSFSFISLPGRLPQLLYCVLVIIFVYYLSPLFSRWTLLLFEMTAPA